MARMYRDRRKKSSESNQRYITMVGPSALRFGYIEYCTDINSTYSTRLLLAQRHNGTASPASSLRVTVPLGAEDANTEESQRYRWHIQSYTIEIPGILHIYDFTGFASSATILDQL